MREWECADLGGGKFITRKLDELEMNLAPIYFYAKNIFGQIEKQANGDTFSGVSQDTLPFNIQNTHSPTL